MYLPFFSRTTGKLIGLMASTNTEHPDTAKGWPRWKKIFYRKDISLAIGSSQILPCSFLLPYEQDTLSLMFHGRFSSSPTFSLWLWLVLFCLQHKAGLLPSWSFDVPALPWNGFAASRLHFFFCPFLSRFRRFHLFLVLVVTSAGVDWSISNKPSSPIQQCATISRGSFTVCLAGLSTVWSMAFIEAFNEKFSDDSSSSGIFLSWINSDSSLSIGRNCSSSLLAGNASERRYGSPAMSRKQQD